MKYTFIVLLSLISCNRNTVSTPAPPALTDSRIMLQTLLSLHDFYEKEGRYPDTLSEAGENFIFVSPQGEKSPLIYINPEPLSESSKIELWTPFPYHDNALLRMDSNFKITRVSIEDLISNSYKNNAWIPEGKHTPDLELPGWREK